MDCEELKSSVLRWMGQEIECHASGDSLTAVLPILKPNGDPIEIGLIPAGQNWKVSDLGGTYETFYLAGLDIAEESGRAEEFRQVIVSHKLLDSDHELSIITSPDELVPVMFDFVHAIQSMLGLQFTAQPRLPTRDFPSIVAKFLSDHRASYEIPPAPIAGLTGKWKFNFVLNHTKEETLVKALSAPTVTRALGSAKQSVFEVNDVRALRGASKPDAVAIIDDEGERARLWPERILAIFEGYSVPAISFNRNRDRLEQLALKYAIS